MPCPNVMHDRLTLEKDVHTFYNFNMKSSQKKLAASKKKMQVNTCKSRENEQDVRLLL
jgi:hypothetical protein